MISSDPAKNLFNFYALLIVYSSLAVTGIDSEQFLLPGQKLELPVVSLEVGIKRFLILSSIAVYTSYLFWNIHLIRFQKATKEADWPWIVSFYENPEPGIVGVLEKTVAITLRWWSAPIAVTLLTVELVKFHSPIDSYLIVILPILAIATSIALWRLSDRTGNYTSQSQTRHFWELSRPQWLLAIASTAVMGHHLFGYVPGAHEGKEMEFLGITSISNVININSKVISNPSANCNHRNYLVLDEANLQGASVRRGILENVSLVDANFRNANLAYASLKCSDLRHITLDNAEILNTDFFKSDLRGVVFKPLGMSAVFSHFDSADLEKADFRGVDLKEVSFKGARLSQADLSGAENLTIEQLQEAQFIYHLKVDEPLLSQLDSARFNTKDPNDRNRVFPFN